MSLRTSGSTRRTLADATISATPRTARVLDISRSVLAEHRKQYTGLMYVLLRFNQHVRSQSRDQQLVNGEPFVCFQ
jgi:hypothetical protein